MFYFKLLKESNTWHLLPVNIKSDALNIFFIKKNDFLLKSIIIEFTNIVYYCFIFSNNLVKYTILDRCMCSNIFNNQVWNITIIKGWNGHLLQIEAGRKCEFDGPSESSIKLVLFVYEMYCVCLYINLYLRSNRNSSNIYGSNTMDNSNFILSSFVPLILV